jgi:hypothetical protein
MVDAMGLKIMHLGPCECYHLPTKFHEKLPSGSKVINEEYTGRLTGDLISLHSFLESRLKMDLRGNG